MTIESLLILDGLISPDEISLHLPVFKDAEVRIHNDKSLASAFLAKFDSKELGVHEKRQIEAVISSSLFVSLIEQTDEATFTANTYTEYSKAVGTLGMTIGFFSSVLFLIRPHELQMPFVLSIFEADEGTVCLLNHTVLNLYSLVRGNEQTTISAKELNQAFDIFNAIMPQTETTIIDRDLSMRVVALIQSARESSFPMQSVALLVSAMECLLLRNNSGGELTHQFSERLASLVCIERADRLNTYKNAKKLYVTRSKFYHGSSLDKAEEVTQRIEEATGLLRTLIVSDEGNTLRHPFLFKKLERNEDKQAYSDEMLNRVML